MSRNGILSLFSVLALSLAIPHAEADDVKVLSGVPSQKDWVNALKPKAKPDGLTFRGIIVNTKKETVGARRPEVEKASAPTETPAAVANQMQFDLNSSELRPETKQVLDTLGPAMNSSDLKSKRFRIQGHTDDIGAEDTNRRLSEDRAGSVAKYLEERYGVSSDRLEVVGKGSSEPLDPSHPDDPVNRRVQIVTLSD